MDIAKLIKDHGPALATQLTGKAGFTAGQASAFLPLIVGKVMEALKGGQFDITSLIGGGDAGALIGKLGLGAIAKQVGVDEPKAIAGAKAVVPGIVGALSKNAGGLAGLMGGASAGGAADLLKKAKGLFS